MNKDTERVRELLPSSADPAAECGDRELLTPRAVRELAELRRSVVPPATRPTLFSRRRILVGSAAAGVSAALVVVGQRLIAPGAGPHPVAYTPPVLRLKSVGGMTGSAYLLAFASRVEKLPQEPASGTYRYMKTWGWWLNTAGDVPGGGTASAAVPTVTESWIRRDGSGRQRSAYGEPLYPDPSQREAAEKAGLIAGAGERDRTYGPGQAPTVEGDAWGDVAPFSTDPRELAQQVEQVSWEGGMIANGVSDLINYAARSGPVHPRLRAAALRVLARSPQVDVTTTTTWQGRQVIVVSQSETYQGSTQRESVFFDPATGYPSGFESALFGGARSLNISVPATLSVGETLHRGWVPSMDERP